MAILAYPFEVRDSANSSTDNRKTGLTPAVANGKTLAASPATVTAAGNVSVVEVGAGIYVALYDAETNGDASFPIDWGAALANPNDRYGSLVLTRDAGRIVTNLDAQVSTRSTYAGADTAGTGTLLSRLTSQRATNLDNLDAQVSTRSTFAGGAVASVTGNVGGNVIGNIGGSLAGAAGASAPSWYANVILDSGVVSASSNSFAPFTITVAAMAAPTGQYSGRRLYLAFADGTHLMTDACATHVKSGSSGVFTFAAAQNRAPAAGDVADVVS